MSLWAAEDCDTIPLQHGNAFTLAPSGKFHFLKNATAIPLTLYALGESCHSPTKRCPPLEGGRPCDCPDAESPVETLLCDFWVPGFFFFFFWVGVALPVISCGIWELVPWPGIELRSPALGLPWWLSSKESAWNAGATGDAGLIPRSRRSLGGGHGNTLQCSCLKNPMDRGAWQATVHRIPKSWTRLKRLTMHACTHPCFGSVVS